MENNMRKFINIIKENMTSDIIIEYIEKLPYTNYIGDEIELILIWNPSPAQTKNLIGKTRFHTLRGLIVENELVVWNAEYVEHNDVADLIGHPELKRNRTNKIVIKKDKNDTYRFESSIWYLNREHYLNNKIIKRMLDNGIEEPMKKVL